jgi:hypothetical protein
MRKGCFGMLMAVSVSMYPLAAREDQNYLSVEAMNVRASKSEVLSR